MCGEKELKKLKSAWGERLPALAGNGDMRWGKEDSGGRKEKARPLKI